MNSRSIIMVGIALALLLMLSCISLNASKFYNQLEVAPRVELEVKSTIKLRDRTS